jgi:hypothetical protein
LLACLAIHLFFAYPTLHHTLSDLPASLFLLIGIWCFSLSRYLPQKKYLLFILTGLCWGLAYGIRVFYLYPILASWLLLAIFGMARKKIFYLMIIMPILTLPLIYQSYLVQQHSGKLSFYLNSNSSGYWTKLHLESADAGYDTILPGHGYFWKSPLCQTRKGLMASLETFDLLNTACLMFNRLYFYLGSYSPTAYLPAPAETVTDEIEILDQLTASRFFGASDQADEYLLTRGNIRHIPGPYQPIHLGVDWNYQISLSSRSEQGTSLLKLSIEDFQGHVVKSILALSPHTHHVTEATPHLLSFNIKQEGDYRFTIQFYDFTNPSLRAAAVQKQYPTLLQDQVLISDIQLRQYRSRPPQGRLWSKWLFALNAIPFLLTAVCLLFCYQKGRTEDFISGLLIFMCLGMSLVIIPEQRFFIPVGIFIWVRCMEWLSLRQAPTGQ